MDCSVLASDGAGLAQGSLDSEFVIRSWSRAAGPGLNQDVLPLLA